MLKREVREETKSALHGRRGRETAMMLEEERRAAACNVAKGDCVRTSETKRKKREKKEGKEGKREGEREKEEGRKKERYRTEPAAAEGSDEVRSRDERAEPSRAEPLARSIERTKLPPMLCDGCAAMVVVVNPSSGTCTPCRALAMANESEYTTISTFTTIIALCYATTSP